MNTLYYGDNLDILGTMIKKSALSVSLTTLTLLSLGNLVLCQSTRFGDDCAKSSIYKNWLIDSILSDTVIDGQRKVEVLLSQRTFSECDLKWVFDIVAKRYAQPEDLLITVRSTIDDDEKGPWSLYLRRDGGEGFQYKPSGSYKGVRTVILRGTDPFDKKKNKSRSTRAMPVTSPKVKTSAVRQVYNYPNKTFPPSAREAIS